MRGRLTGPSLLGLGILCLDQGIKAVVQAHMVLGESIPVFRHVFHITYILNPGAAFGILENQRLLFIFLGFLLLGAAIGFRTFLRQAPAEIRYSAALLLGGAVGNLIDRIQTGTVVDFLDFRIWPIFNLADIAIVCGVGGLFYAIVFQMKETKP